jgi:hypothetical protein
MANDNGITIGQLTEQLNQKMDLPTGVSQDTIDYVVEWKTPTADDPTWYRKYKSGWLEQGGTAGIGNDGEYFIKFPKPFADTQYTILKTNNWYLTSAAEYKWMNIWGKTTTSATTYNARQSTGGVGFSWSACGQGA